MAETSPRRPLPPDADLGRKPDAELPDGQLPVYRGEAAKVKVNPKGRALSPQEAEAAVAALRGGGQPPRR